LEWFEDQYVLRGAQILVSPGTRQERMGGIFGRRFNIPTAMLQLLVAVDYSLG